MLALKDVDRIVSDTAAVHLPHGRLKRVMVEPYINTIDAEAWRILLVIGEDDPIVSHGAAISDLMLDVSDRLWEAGEPRSQVVTFATEDELAHSSDPDT